MSILAHLALLAALIIVPLLATATLPVVASAINWVPVDVVLPPPPPPVRVQAASPPAPVVHPGAPPITAPEGIQTEPQVRPTTEPEPTIGSGVVDGTADITSALARLEPAALPPPPVEAPKPVRVGGNVLAPRKIHDVAPAYPSIAQAARVQGVVIMEATIGVDGTVQNVRVLRSIPLLDDAAIEAVRQWAFTPTRLNGIPVPVVMTVTVNFALK